jgi:hypothetical protein
LDYKFGSEVVLMNEPWVILTRRYGNDTRNPTPSQLAEAIAELYHETLPDMTESDYAEHRSASLRYGCDDGPMFVLEVSRLHQVTLEEWADQDYGQQLAPPRRMQGISEERALRLWTSLAQGDIERVRSEPWE